MPDGAAGDPASNGIGVLLANWSSPTNDKYLRPVQQQIDFLENQVPHGDNGVISHRTEQLQLWAGQLQISRIWGIWLNYHFTDFISMVPPFFAYYGAMQPGTKAETKYLWAAYNQIKLYREALRDPATNLWHHVLWGGWEDRGFWATGQGWAAYGILRVQQTIAKSSLRPEMSQQSGELLEWAEELVAATWKYAQPDGSLKNYLDRDDSFTELASTTLMAAATYRLAVLTNITAHIPAADKAFQLVKTKIDADGWLLDVVDPYGYAILGSRAFYISLTPYTTGSPTLANTRLKAKPSH
jgi:rhamnogalacturonyl hydrolase YesR